MKSAQVLALGLDTKIPTTRCCNIVAKINYLRTFIKLFLFSRYSIGDIQTFDITRILDSEDTLFNLWQFSCLLIFIPEAVAVFSNRSDKGKKGCLLPNKRTLHSHFASIMILSSYMGTIK